jgi:hypothetical protein
MEDWGSGSYRALRALVERDVVIPQKVFELWGVPEGGVDGSAWQTNFTNFTRKKN